MTARCASAKTAKRLRRVGAQAWRAAWLAAWLLAFSPPATLLAADASGAGPASPGFEELLLETRLNDLPPAITLLALRDREGRLWIPAETFRGWAMHPPGAAIDHLGEDFRGLDGQPGLAYSVDPSRLTLAIEAGPQWFEGNRIDSGVNRRGARPRVDPGAFFNYDLDATHAEAETTRGGLFELGAFGGWGVAIATAVVRGGYAGPGDAARDEVVRLDTTWTRDLPERRASLRIGDAIGGASAWGRPVRFGGIQFATNFATQPGFVSFPLPSLHGEAALPSTLDLYVNGMRRMTSEVPTGPFEIPDLPAVTGQGQVQLVVTDLLGRQQIITDRFYVSSRLLQAGLHEFAYELGAERDAYGYESFDYGRTFAAGTHRYGINDRFTAEGRVEILSGQYTAGAGGALLLGGYGVAHGAVAGSHAERGDGGQLTLGFEHASRRLGFGFSLQLASAAFTQLGLRDDDLAPRARGQAWLSLPFGRAGSASLSYVRRDERDPEQGLFESFNVGYQRSLGRFLQLGVFASRIRGQQEDTIVGFNLTRAFGTRTTSSLNGNFSRDSDQLVMQIQRGLPFGPGFGYYARAGGLDQDRLDAGVSAQNDMGTWRLEASHAEGQTGLRATASGGLAWLGGGVHLSRRMDQSFAIVEVGDFAGVRVYADNQHVATTDADGRALLPRLRAYEENPVRIEVGDLPIAARIEQVEQRAVPWYRSGLVVEFAVSRARSASFRLRRPGGEPVPAGSVIYTPGGEPFPVGYEGEAFVTGVEPGAPLSARWNGTRCDFELTWPPAVDAGADPLPDLGTITCREQH
jgi:outer membrane usher protein